MLDEFLLRIVPAPEGDEGLRVIVSQHRGPDQVWKALAVEVVLDTTPGPMNVTISSR